ncbi:hypothetical protein [Klebsiella spallanzanii]|uniref:hypothetical protein n=1 Tax=Klebsiella spallanzanii TaxID=2587528 RepID=UPI0011184CE3|nr:hypothetical protein [Klebsiella spallanzanii]MDM4205612.1 hypothetical protein [Klebsiella spallanzanii]
MRNRLTPFSFYGNRIGHGIVLLSISSRCQYLRVALCHDTAHFSNQTQRLKSDMSATFLEKDSQKHSQNAAWWWIGTKNPQTSYHLPGLIQDKLRFCTLTI